jgi:hypothetical protein
VRRIRIRSWVALLVIIVSVYSCIETFFPQLPNKSGYLVIDAMVTNEERSYDVYITRSVTALNSKVTYVKGAIVSISDSDGKEYFLQEITTGHYITDKLKFTGKIGGKYILHIKTGSEVYQSDTCQMFGSSKIDRLTFGKSSKFLENGTSEVAGLSIYLDGTVSDIKNYVRWDFNEVWKYVTAYPPAYTFSPPSTFNPIQPKNRYCWKKANSTDIIVGSFQDQANGNIRNKELAFFITNASDRFNQRYSVLVNQYVISRAEFEFWNNMKASNQESGGIFEKQPYTTAGNIHNLRNPNETVLGYFQVASISSMRLYITPFDVNSLRLSTMINPCNTEIYQLGDPGPTSPFTSLKMIIDYLAVRDSVMIGPFYSMMTGLLVGVIATSKTCSDCSLSADPNMPSFWIDENK